MNRSILFKQTSKSKSESLSLFQENKNDVDYDDNDNDDDVSPFVDDFDYQELKENDQGGVAGDQGQGKGEVNKKANDMNRRNWNAIGDVIDDEEMKGFVLNDENKLLESKFRCMDYPANDLLKTIQIVSEIYVYSSEEEYSEYENYNKDDTAPDAEVPDSASHHPTENRDLQSLEQRASKFQSEPESGLLPNREDNPQSTSPHQQRTTLQSKEDLEIREENDMPRRLQDKDDSTRNNLGVDQGVVNIAVNILANDSPVSKFETLMRSRSKSKSRIHSRSTSREVRIVSPIHHENHIHQALSKSRLSLESPHTRMTRFSEESPLIGRNRFTKNSPLTRMTELTDKYRQTQEQPRDLIMPSHSSKKENFFVARRSQTMKNRSSYAHAAKDRTSNELNRAKSIDVSYYKEYHTLIDQAFETEIFALLTKLTSGKLYNKNLEFQKQGQPVLSLNRSGTVSNDSFPRDSSSLSLRRHKSFSPQCLRVPSQKSDFKVESKIPETHTPSRGRSRGAEISLKGTILSAFSPANHRVGRASSRSVSRSRHASRVRLKAIPECE